MFSTTIYKAIRHLDLIHSFNKHDSQMVKEAKHRVLLTKRVIVGRRKRKQNFTVQACKLNELQKLLA